MNEWRTLAEPTYGIDYQGDARLLAAGSVCRFSEDRADGLPGTIVLDVRESDGRTEGTWWWFVTASALRFEGDAPGICPDCWHEHLEGEPCPPIGGNRFSGRVAEVPS